jgi:hypothetical protein
MASASSSDLGVVNCPVEPELSGASPSRTCRVYKLRNEDVVEKKIMIKKTTYEVTPTPEMPACVRALCEGTMQALSTDGDGACALHAVFGRPSSSGQLFLPDARRFAAELLGPAPNEMVRRGALPIFVDFIKTGLWSEYAVPYFEGGQDTESVCFAEALEGTLPALAREARETHDASQLPPFTMTSGPPDFGDRSWPAYLHCIQKNGYYFSVDELLVMSSQKEMNIAVFTEAEGKLTYEGGHFSGTEPLVCAKLNGGVGRVRGHFERIVASSEVESLMQAARAVADENSPRKQSKRSPLHLESSQPSQLKKPRTRVGEKSGGSAAKQSHWTAGETSTSTIAEKNESTTREKHAPAAGEMRLTTMDCPLATGPDISMAEIPSHGLEDNVQSSGPTLAREEEEKSDSSEENDVAEDVYFAVRAREDTLRFSEQDQWAACWRSLAEHLRDRPTLPASWGDADQSSNDVDSAVRLPLFLALSSNVRTAQTAAEISWYM